MELNDYDIHDEIQSLLEDPDAITFERRFDFEVTVRQDIQRVCQMVLKSQTSNILIMRSAEAIQNDFDAVYSDLKMVGNILIGKNKIRFEKFYEKAYRTLNFSNNFWYDFILDFSSMVRHDSRINAVTYLLHIYIFDKYGADINIDNPYIDNISDYVFSIIPQNSCHIEDVDCIYRYVNENGEIVEIINGSMGVRDDIVYKYQNFLVNSESQDNYIEKEWLEDGNLKKVLVYKHSWEDVVGRFEI